MKKLIATAFVAASLIGGPGVILTSTSALADCGPDAPEAWSRPGGYCSSIAPGGTLVSPVEACDETLYVVPLSSMLEEKDVRVDVAVTCTVYCYYPEVVPLGMIENLPVGERVRVAQSECYDNVLK